MKLLTVVGARPQFVKAASVSRPLRERATECLVHTGQHYDEALSASQFRDLGLPDPDHVLVLPRRFDTAGARVAHLIRALRTLIQDEAPDRVLIYGDTDSTLAGALAAQIAGVSLAHVEAGLRSGRLAMPEEGNRIVADHLSDLLLCPVPSAAETLRREGASGRIETPGDVMLDTFLAREAEFRTDDAATRLGVQAGNYVVATLHRPENVDLQARLTDILNGLAAAETTVLLPAHPRARAAMEGWQAARASRGGAGVRLIDPLPYGELMALVARAKGVLTDSGGLQKEAYFLGVPCATVRTETEWPETFLHGWNQLVAATSAEVERAVRGFAPGTGPADRAVFGGGCAARAIAELLVAG